MKFLTALREDMVKNDPSVFMDEWEKLAYLKDQQKGDDDHFDTSPCPKNEIADLEGVGDAEGIMDRALTLANGDMEKLADVLGAKDKATSKWRRK